MQDSHINILENNPFSSSYKDDENNAKNPSITLQVVAENQRLAEGLSSSLNNTTKPFHNCEIRLFSYLSSGENSSIIPISGQAIKEDVVTIYLGKDRSTLKALFDGFQFAEQYFNIALVQRSIGHPTGIDHILLPIADPFLHCTYILGNQAMLTNQDFLDQYAERGLFNYRLGNLAQGLDQTEPWIRSSQIFAIDLSALKYSDAPFQMHKNPVGCSVEQACQLAYYAGRSERNKAFCLYGMEDGAVDKKVHSMLLSNLVWYFLQGSNSRSAGYPVDVSRMQTYLVDGQIENLTLEFYKDEQSQKWWLKNPLPKSRLASFYPLIACDYQDYNYAISDGVISDRIRRQLLLL